MVPHRRWLIVALSVMSYALLWIAYGLQWSWLTDVDNWALDPLYEYGSRHPGWVQFWDVICSVFGPGAFRLLGVVVIVIALALRNLRAAVFLFAAIAISGVATLLGKYLADRARPEGALVYLSDTSFPSGHAVAVMAAVLALLTVSAGLLGPRARLVTVIAGALIVVAVGVGRVVLNVHHPSDVLAGWALGYLWFVFCLVLVRPRPLSRMTRPALSADAAMDEIPEVRDSAS